MTNNTCVVCGAIIPEGRQFCPSCDTLHKEDMSTWCDTANSLKDVIQGSKLPHSKLEKLGFEYVENLNVYQASSSDSYYTSVVEIKIFDDLSASIFMTDIHSKWSRDISRKAVTALSSQNLSW